jgi:hypothetical protein
MAQCDYTTSVGQCANEAVAPGRFCSNHSAQASKTLINQYRIACSVLGDSPERHASDSEMKSVKGEIAIIRSLLESRLNMIQNDAELVAAMPLLKDYALAVEKLATSCHTMDVKLSNLLSKNVLLSLAQDMIGIIDSHVRRLVDTQPTSKDIDFIIESIGREIVEAIAATENEQK